MTGRHTLTKDTSTGVTELSYPNLSSTHSTKTIETQENKAVADFMGAEAGELIGDELQKNLKKQ